MKTPLVIASLFISLMVFGQDFQALDGNTYSKGDTIIIGIHSGYKSYDDIKEYYTTRYSSGYQDVKVNLAFKKYIIKSIGTNSELAKKLYWDEEDIIVRFGTTGFLGDDYYANLNDAVKSGEIISRLPDEGNWIENDKLNDSIAFVYFVKTSPIPTDKFGEEYLYRFMYEKYKSSHEDEFEYYSSVEKAKQTLKSILPKVDFNKQFSLYTSFYLDNYDFENKGFLIRDDNPKYEVADDKNWGQHPSIYIVFPDFEKYKFVSIDPNNANAYIKRKKDRYGDVDRKAYAKINFQIVDVDESKNRIKQIFRKRIVR
jgi:hypothetical protein